MEEDLVKALIVGADQATQLNDEEKALLRTKISLLEQTLALEEQLDLKIEHHFSKGVYAREMRAPKGSVIIGKIHRHQNLNILSQGEISIVSIDGIQRMKAPCTIVSSPGVKRLAYVHEDVVWTTIHGTDEKDLDKIENEFIAKDYNDLLESAEIPALTEGI